MATYRNISGTWKVGNPYRNVGGVWKAGVLWRNIAGTWKVVGGQFTVTMSPPSVNASGSASPFNATCTAVPVNGIGPFTYSWSFAGDAINLTNTTSQTVNISSGAMGPGTEKAGTLTCIVTDTATGLTGSGSASYDFQRF